MDTEDFPPPPPEVLEREPKAVGTNNEDEDEGEQFDFDSGDEIPEADRQAIVLPPPDPENNIEHQEADATGADHLENSEKLQTSEPAVEGAPAKVNPYSVINISPIQDKDPSSSPEPSPQDECASPNLSGGYSVPVPCGYAVPSNLPLILPAYSSPVIIRSVSVDEEGMQSATEECNYNSVNSEEPQNSEDNQTKREDDALAKWVADPANTAWMENTDEVIYDDVPREDSDSEPALEWSAPDGVTMFGGDRIDLIVAGAKSLLGMMKLGLKKLISVPQWTMLLCVGTSLCCYYSVRKHVHQAQEAELGGIWDMEQSPAEQFSQNFKLNTEDINIISAFILSPRTLKDSEKTEEMIYDDVENGDDGGNSSLEYGWSSSEFESYEEQSDSECKNGIPSSFLRGNHKRHLSHDLTRLKEHYEKKMKDLMANTVGAVEIQQLKQKHELKMQKLMRAAREGTKDGLEKTKAAVKKGRSFIRTKSFISQDHRSSCLEEEELNLFIDVDCLHTEAIMTPMPEGLSQQQVVRRYILGSVVDSEKNYVDALKRILEQYEKPLSDMEPKLLSERKLKMVFYRIKEILQCHSMFQIALASRVSEWDSVEMIGDVFVASFSKSMVLDAYSEYVNNFSTAVGILKKSCATKPAFLDFLKQCQESSPDRITLYGLMMKPIQRFPQFILLLQDMLKNTNKGHPDRLPLQMALTELETLAEKLNERKRDADQRCEIKQIAKAMNERYLNKLLSSGNRYLIRTDDMVETVYNDKGEIIKTKERRLFMLNDVLMCATVNTRSSCESSGTMTTGQRYLLKWSVPLGQVEVIEYGSSEGQGENCRFPPQHSAENIIINSKPNKVYMGPGQLYHDLQNLLHDLNVLGQISQLISSLKGNYQNLNQSVAHDWTSGLQKLILKKEDEIRAADRCRIQLQLPGKQDKSGRPTFFTAVFNTFTPAIKQSWINNLQMAKLALVEDNLLGWFCVEDDGNQIKKEKHPLLVRHMPVMMAKQQEFKIECAAYNPEPYPSGETDPDSCATEHGFLWIGSCTNQMGQIAIVSFQSSSPKVIECFNVESRILCMVYIPEEEKLKEQNKALDSENVLAKTSNVPTVCLGMEEGSISIYKSCQGSKKIRLQHFFAPEKSTVMSLTYKSQYLFAGLVNGNISIYTKTEDGMWNTEPQKIVKLGVLPVRSLLVMEETIWAACGGQIFIISTVTHSIEPLGDMVTVLQTLMTNLSDSHQEKHKAMNHFEAHQEEGMVISHMAVAGVGVWIAFTSGSTLRLFHTETLKHLQDVNIATPVHNMLPGQQRVSVTSLLVCHGLLLVGTNLGIIVALPVPRLQGIPKVTGRGMVSYHAHNSPVKFLVTATSINKKNRNKLRNSLPPGSEPKDDDQKNILHSERPGSSLSNTHDTAIWLGGSAGSIAQRSDLSSSSGSLTLSHGSSSLEHRPEDSTIYELLKDQNISFKSKRQKSKKMKASSVLVISGGQGHRRVNKKTKQQRQDELVSSVMVWQIPLLNI